MHLPTKVGDVVYCADHHSEIRENCWINGGTITRIIAGDSNWFFDRVTTADGEAIGYSHQLFVTTTVKGEVYTPQEIMVYQFNKMREKNI